MSTRQFFTCDEALELVLHEMDDEFIASAESESEEGSSSDENAEIADEESEFVTELSQEFPQENILVEGGAGPAPESSDMGVSESSVRTIFLQTSLIATIWIKKWTQLLLRIILLFRLAR